MTSSVQVRTLPNGNLDTASQQWRSRPDDQRFLTLEDLYASVLARREASIEPVMPLRNLTVKYDNDGEMWINGRLGRALFTHHSFGQLCTAANVPASYLRRIPAQLATENLQYGLSNNMEQAKLLVIPADANHDGRFIATTGPNYGRIWDAQIVRKVMDLNVNGNWEIPAASYQNANPLRATTLYASDHDVFMFLVDPKHPIEIEGETLFRGFYAWNNETGDRKFGLTTFLYRYVCDNRIIWGAEDVNELIIKHTSGGPERFAQLAGPALNSYAESSTKTIEAQISTAKHKQVAKSLTESVAWLEKQGFTKSASRTAALLAEKEEGDPTSLWNMVQGLTAYARTIEHADTRITFEQKASNLMKLAA